MVSGVHPVFWPCLIRERFADIASRDSTDDESEIHVLSDDAIFIEEETDEMQVYTRTTGLSQCEKKGQSNTVYTLELLGLKKLVNVFWTSIVPFSALRLPQKLVQFLFSTFGAVATASDSKALRNSIICVYAAAIYAISQNCAKADLRLFPGNEPEMIVTQVPLTPSASGEHGDGQPRKVLRNRSWRCLQAGAEIVHLGDVVVVMQHAIRFVNVLGGAGGGAGSKVDGGNGSIQVVGTGTRVVDDFLPYGRVLMVVVRIQCDVGNQGDAGKVTLFGFLCHLEEESDCRGGGGGSAHPGKLLVKQSWFESAQGLGASAMQFVEVVCTAGFVSKFHPDFLGCSFTEKSEKVSLGLFRPLYI
ncbi:hypothetical protein HDU82_000768 [Entophlyctis luteolus]|nr:hypothetical protein HDU82_000768 [Entophlyctis luteolus]